MTCFLLPTLPFILKEEQAARAQDCESVFQEDLTFERLGSVLDFDGSLEYDSLIGVHLARAKIGSAEGDYCIGGP